MATEFVEKRDLERLEEFTVNTRWLLENMDKLRPKYGDRYVAVSEEGGKIVDAGSMDELLGKLSKLNVDAGLCAVEFITREKYVLIV